jgi:ABC-type branched-subunit amino acid transport system substrate-binding protein
MKRWPRNINVIGCVSVGALTLLSACGSSTSSSSSSAASIPSGPVTIAATFDQTGIDAEFGLGVGQGAQVAAKEINDNGGILGHQVNLVTADSASDPADTVPAVQKLITIDKPVADVGPEQAQLQAAKSLFDRAKIPFFASGGDISLDKANDPLLWRSVPSDSSLGAGIIKYALSKGYKKAVLLFQNEQDLQALRSFVQAAWTKSGGSVVADIQPVPGQSSYRSEAQNLINAHPDVVFTQMVPDVAATFFQNLKELNNGTLPAPFVGTDVTHGDQWIKAIGASTAEQFLTSVDVGTFTSSASDHFLSLYKAMYPARTQPTDNSGYTYDAVIALALAMTEAHSTASADIVAALPKVCNPPGTTVDTYAQGVAAIKAGTKINYEGATGPIDFDSHHGVFGPFNALQLQSDGVTLNPVLQMSAADLAKVTALAG